MTPQKTHGLIQAVANDGPAQAAALRKEAEEMRKAAAENDRVAAVIEAMVAVASPHARVLEAA